MGRIFKRFAALVVLALAILFAGGLALAWRGFGQRPSGERLARMQRSPEYHDGKFVNALPMWNDWRGALTVLLHASPNASPSAPPNAVRPAAESFRVPPQTGLRVTWFGHSSALIEIDGVRILTDPLWG
ncbi:MAG: hypothetical protein ABIT38_01600, partial [Gemmatimonadaceae bacterium]